jgi:hypothetical protein
MQNHGRFNDKPEKEGAKLALNPEMPESAVF